MTQLRAGVLADFLHDGSIFYHISIISQLIKLAAESPNAHNPIFSFSGRI
jgi:hypothetical protein